MLETLSQEEIGILFATKYSENCQTAAQLARLAETYGSSAQKTIDLLVRKGILEPFEQEWDSTTRYGYAGNDYAQAVYDEVYGPIELDHRWLGTDQTDASLRIGGGTGQNLCVLL